MKDASSNDKCRFIFDLIRKLYHRTITQFEHQLSHYLISSVSVKPLFQLTAEDMERAYSLYKEQCPVIWADGLDLDTSMLYALAIGIKHNCEYLLHLVDSFYRSSGDEQEWFKTNPHMQQIK